MSKTPTLADLQAHLERLTEQVADLVDALPTLQKRLTRIETIITIQNHVRREGGDDGTAEGQ